MSANHVRALGRGEGGDGEAALEPVLDRQIQHLADERLARGADEDRSPDFA